MRRLRIVVLAVAFGTAFALLGFPGHIPEAAADPASQNWDVVFCEGTSAPNDPECLSAAGTTGGDGDGVLEPGENPEVRTYLALDLSPAVADEAFFAMANSAWQGIAPTPGVSIADGDRVGEVSFTIQSNWVDFGTSNVDPATGQPPSCAAGVALISDMYDIYDAELGVGDGLDQDGDTIADEEVLDGKDNDGDGRIDEDNATVSSDDTDWDGLPQALEDNVLADGVTPGSNGLMDGIDLMPDALATGTIPSIDMGWPIGRAFGMAVLSGIPFSTPQVNFLLYDFDVDGDSVKDGYLSVTVVNYPGQPIGKPWPNMNGLACPPFISTVRNYGVNQGNPAYDANGDTVAEGIPAGTVNRTAGGAGTYPYRLDIAQTDNYDGDAAAEPWDSCSQSVSIDTDLIPVQTDPDGDGWDSSCDPWPASADNDGDTTVGPYLLPPTGTFPLDPGSCNTVAPYDDDGDTLANEDTWDGIDNDADGRVDEDPPEGGWECDQDVDGDLVLNTIDNCPTVADADLDGDTFIDWQQDTDRDTVGDVCDPAPGIPGDGTGYTIDAHPHGMPGQPPGYHSHDDRCVDQFTIPGTELPDPAPNGFCISAGPDGAQGTGDDGRPWVDSNNDGDPDWDDADQDGVYDVGEPIDTNSDRDGDGDTDACEAVNGTDPLDPASRSGVLALDCDGASFTDAAEEVTGILNPFVVGGEESVVDTDMDALPDVAEAALGCTVGAIDTDGGGIPDGFELAMGLDCADSTDDTIDTDGDGLNDYEEIQMGSNPVVGDTDGDGIPDSEDACPYAAGFADRQACPVGDANTVTLHIIDQAKSGACLDGAGGCTSPIEGAEIRVLDRNDAAFQATYGTKNPSGAIYPQVFDNDIGRVGACTTDATGQCTAGEVFAGDYLVIVKWTDPVTDRTVYTGKPKSPADFVDGLATKDFQVLKVIRKDGSIQYSGGSKTVVSGSYLEIIRPDFAVWGDAAAGYVYPFILTSDSDWTVDLCANVPTGYAIVGVYDENGDLVSDSRCIHTFVAGETKVVAYEVVEMGSPEPRLGARLRLRHQGEVTTLDLSVPGIRKARQHAPHGPLAGGMLPLAPALVIACAGLAGLWRVTRSRSRR